ncbi:hypothetical protein AZI86_00260 [Bdellovibrio bacteriovorus]|uniref:Uncharacterized protein n=2 Tax=Bdellovibrio bacteriovorus TaxID=959 RepID=A0A150WMD5_BDEBC|nr:hypothetical protein AZI86_00260 [Bdellovibrio bacteriovorus]
MVNALVQKMHDHWAAYLIVFQVGLNALGVSLIFCMTIIRKGSLKETAEVMPKLHERVTDICCGMNMDIQDLLKLKTRHRLIVRGLILKAVDSVSGAYRENLEKLYRDMGFLAEDQKLLHSSSFAKRLSALSRIDILKDSESAGQVGKMLHDPSPYVHFAALKFLLKIKCPKLYVNIAKELNLLKDLGRMDTAMQILEMYASASPEDFLELLKTHQSREVVSICLEVVNRLQVVEALPIVKDQLIDGLRCEGFPEFEDFDFRRYTLCLTMAPDEESEEILQKMTRVETAFVRNVAYLSLLKIRPDLKMEITQRLSVDESPHGQRLYRQILEPAKALRKEA